MVYEDYDDDFGPSKSQLKREAEAVQRLGETIVELTAPNRALVPLDEELKDAIEQAVRLRESKNNSYRRQLQFIGRLMRSRDMAPMEAALQRITQHHGTLNAQAHKVEQWRTRLLAKGDQAITALMDSFPAVERQTLRQLVRQAQKEQLQQKPPKAFRELYLFLQRLHTQ